MSSQHLLSVFRKLLNNVQSTLDLFTNSNVSVIFTTNLKVQHRIVDSTRKQNFGGIFLSPLPDSLYVVLSNLYVDLPLNHLSEIIS